MCQLLRTKTLASGSKCIKHFFFIFTTIYLIPVEKMSGCNLFNMPCLSLNLLMASLYILCTNSLNLKNKITNIEHKKIFCGPSTILKNISWPISISLKHFMAPQKPSASPPSPLPPSSYILNARSLTCRLASLNFIMD